MNKGTQTAKASEIFSRLRGFRDILFTEAARRERIVNAVSSYFAGAGYELVETPSVENPATLLVGQQDLSNTFRFVDVDGKLIALRSDVTGSLARVVATRFSLIDPPYRLRYVADVFQEQESLRGSDRQQTQLGLECYGLTSDEGDLEVLGLALGGMRAAGLEGVRLHVSDVRLLEHLSSDKVELLALRGGLELFDKLQAQVDSGAKQALEDLRRCFEALADLTGQDTCEIVADFSLQPAHDYYSGLIFELYAMQSDGRYRSIGRGGRYDQLIELYGRKMPASGFMYDLTSLETVAASFEEAAEQDSLTKGATVPLRIAVPKGKLYDECIDLLVRAGLDVPGLDTPGRALRLANDKYEIIIAKPTDVAIYVSRGVADIGISGLDTLVEADFPLLQLLDLQFGGCEFAIAAPEGMDCSLDELSLRLGTIRVATKYPRLTQRYFDERGVQVEIVKLNGNIELAPLIGISDLIVDLVQTGTTLRENNLRVLEPMLSSTGRFVAHPTAARTDSRVLELAERLEALLESSEPQC